MRKLFKMLIICNLMFYSLMALYALEGPDKKDIYHDNWIDFNKNGKQDPYENPELPIKERVDDLLSRMTMQEKTCQMATLYGFGRVLEDEIPTKEWPNKIWKDGIGNIDEQLNGLDRPKTQTEWSYPHSKHPEAINIIQKWFVEKTHLGIPVDFTNEGIRGICHEKATSFPAQIGVGSTWDVDLVSQIGHITGKEARILGYTNAYSPILDLARDPRWGRAVETYGEDPYLVSQLGVAQVKALQEEGVVSTPKHFAIYSIPKGGRDGGARTDPNATWRKVETIYLAPFRKAFVEGEALGTMSSYNDYNGLPISGTKKFLTEKLRQEWGFQGYVVSDSKAVIFLNSKHQVAETYKEAVRQTVEGGLNIRTAFTPPNVYIDPLRELVEEGKLSMHTIDNRVSDVLRVKFILGLFDQPYVENPELADKIVARKEHQEVSLKTARESMVLLKNDDDILPLNKGLNSILVAGPNAAAIKHSISRYGPSKVDVISVLEGVKNKVSSKTEVKYVKGCNVVDDNWPDSEILPEPPSEKVMTEIRKAAEMAKNVDAAIVVVGSNEETVGESKSRTSLNLPGHQLKLVKAIYETGTPTIVVLINGRALTINWIDRNVPSILEAWFPGEKCGRAVADVLFGDYNPGGKLPVTFPKTVGQLPLNFPYKKGSRAGSHHDTRVEGVLYPFGHGLSYTDFVYSDLAISPKKQADQGKIEIFCKVKNTGKRAGDEVVQLYIRDEISSVVDYESKLRGFDRITLKPGEEKQVKFALTPEDLQILDKNLDWSVEPGKFNVMIGSSSEDIRLDGSFEITN